MVEASSGGHAVLLRDGLVFVVGGTHGGMNELLTSTAEQYDPRTGSWAATADPRTSRLAGHSLTLLPHGGVLVAGGQEGFESPEGGRAWLAAAEVYDPGDGSWSATGSMVDARHSHTGTLLSGGSVLVAGGIGRGDSPGDTRLASAELYDPATGSWTASGDLIEARDGHTATLLRDGAVLVTGGNDSDGLATASAELYDVGTGRWTPVGRMVRARTDHVATLLADGRVLVTGGKGRGGLALASAEIYDPLSASWTATASLSEARAGHAGTQLPGCTVLVAGGYGATSEALASAERFDPATGSWTAAGDMATPRSYFIATLLTNGQVLVAAGGNNSGNVDSAELYGPYPGT
jgi:large repetitive protein